MLREVKSVENRKAAPPRFRIQKLEERIAPSCRTNPKGKVVGKCTPSDPTK